MRGSIQYITGAQQRGTRSEYKHCDVVKSTLESWRKRKVNNKNLTSTKWRVQFLSPAQKGNEKCLILLIGGARTHSEGGDVGQALCLLGPGGPLSCFDVVLIRISDGNAVLLCSLTHFPTRTSQRGCVWNPAAAPPPRCPDSVCVLVLYSWPGPL